MAVTGGGTVANGPAHVRASPGAWLSVSLIVLSFVFGTVALIESSIGLWIAAAVAMLAGIVGALASRMMEQAY